MHNGCGDDAPWSTVTWYSLVLLAGSLVPVPFGRRPEFGPDKLLHFVGYGGLTWLVARALDAEGWNLRDASLLAVGVATGWGVLVGYLQEYVPGRVNERADLAAGVLGAVAGVLYWRRRLGVHGPTSTEPTPAE
jgi:VanZ family protein